MRSHTPETGLTTVAANGLSFGCLEWGEGPLVLLIHGFPDTPHTWDDVGPAIAAQGYRVVAPFTRGYAPTTAPKGDDYGAEHLGRDVVALIEALSDDPAIVIGHDWGAMAAYAAAHLAPQRISRFATVAIPPPTTLKPSLGKLWGARHFIAYKLPGAVKRFGQDDFSDVDAMYARWSPGFDWPKSEFEAAKNAFAADGGHAALGYYRCLQPTPPKFMRKRFTVPALIVGGLTDGVATSADFALSPKAFTADGPNSLCKVVMLPGGHFLHREHPAKFIAAITDWLSG